MTERSDRDPCIVGVHVTEQHRDLSARTGFSLAREALFGALADAGLEPRDVDGIGSEVTGWPNEGSSFVLPEPQFWAAQLGITLRYMTGRVDIPSMLDAAAAIRDGRAEVVALVNGRVRRPVPGVMPDWVLPPFEFTAWAGSYTAALYALLAQQYVDRWGPRALEAMGEASATVRNFGSKNPDAVYFDRGTFTKEAVLASPQIASPLTRLMCSSINDGGAAYVMTTRARAEALGKPAVAVLTGRGAWAHPAYYDPPVLSLDFMAGVRQETTRALDAVGLGHDDIDVVSLYDNFAVWIPYQFELYGFCEIGEGPDLVLSGALSLDGTLPTSTDGGNQSFSHNGIPQAFRIIEGVRQLRGEAADLCPDVATNGHTHDPARCRLVRDARHAFVTNPGPPTGGGTWAVLGR